MILLMASLPPLIWGSTYLVTTELLPPDKPMLAAVLRILPVGIIITCLTHFRPSREQLLKLIVLSFLSMSVFHWLLFVSAYKLPGGLAALLVASQPLVVMMLSLLLFSTQTAPHVVRGVLIGFSGVAMILIAPSNLAWNTTGILSALTAALSMSLSTLLIKRWKLDIPMLAFTGWQLLLGGSMLLPFAMVFEGLPTDIAPANIGGYFYLAFFGTLIPYFLWFNALRHLDPVVMSGFIFLSPLSAIALGYLVLDQALTFVQVAGAIAVFAGILICQNAPKIKQP